MVYTTAYRLADEIRASEEYKKFAALKETVMEDETTAALIREGRKLSAELQMAAVEGRSPVSESMQRYQGIMTVLMAGEETREYLMAEMTMTQIMADLTQIIVNATGVEFALPGMEK